MLSSDEGDSANAFAISEVQTRRFAELSGDYHPLHLNLDSVGEPTFGRFVVHGVHAMLCALDAVLVGQVEPIVLTQLSGKFEAEIGHGQITRHVVAGRGTDGLRVFLFNESRRAQDVRVGWQASQAGLWPVPGVGGFDGSMCRELSFADLREAEGRVPLGLDTELCVGLFPNLLRCVPAIQLAAVLAASRVIGMECPGRYSLFTGLSLRFKEPRGDEMWFRYRTKSAFRAYSLLILSVEGPGVVGELQSFWRRPTGTVRR